MGEQATFYTVTTADYFIGLVALLNSLRLTGHQQELVVLDDGLTPAQRERLEPHVTLVELPGFDPGLPVLKKTFPDLLSPAGVVTQIDTDMIVTGSLDAPARPGRVGAHRSLSRPRVQSRPLVRRMGGSRSASPDRLAARRT